MYDLCHCKNKGLEPQNFGNPFEVDLCEYDYCYGFDTVGIPN